jgi:hypothetical protein
VESSRSNIYGERFIAIFTGLAFHKKRPLVKRAVLLAKVLSRDVSAMNQSVATMRFLINKSSSGRLGRLFARFISSEF